MERLVDDVDSCDPPCMCGGRGGGGMSAQVHYMCSDVFKRLGRGRVAANVAPQLWPLQLLVWQVWAHPWKAYAPHTEVVQTCPHKMAAHGSHQRR